MGRNVKRNPRRRNEEREVVQDREFIELKKVKPRTDNQKEYFASMDKNTVTVGLGPAGSGKTYLAVYAALLSLLSKKKKRLIITRPAVEAGEKLGFLPGDMWDKLDPYMRPIFDSLFDLIGVSATYDRIDKKYIQVEPLAYMRGRTFNDCFIILDEAQNATIEQLKMVLTRVGEGSKLIIGGDPQQSDLPGYKKKSGLHLLKYVLQNVPDVGVVEFTKDDIVRSQIVIDVLRAFEEYERNESV